MSWRGAILTDSGGYQVFSLADLRKITDEGVRFRSHLDGSEHLLTPEKAAEIQLALGSDIAMVLDECIETPAPRDIAEAALKRTTAWAHRARKYFLDARSATATRRSGSSALCKAPHFADLRRESAQQLLELDFPGYAVGGLAVGEPHDVTCEMAGRSHRATSQRPPALPDGGGPPGAVGRLCRPGHRHDGLRVADACGAPRLLVYQRRARADQERALYAKTSVRWMQIVLAVSAGVTRAPIFGICLPPEKSPRRSWPPTTMSTFTLTPCVKSERLSLLDNLKNSRQSCVPATMRVRPEAALPRTALESAARQWQPAIGRVSGRESSGQGKRRNLPLAASFSLRRGASE